MIPSTIGRAGKKQQPYFAQLLDIFCGDALSLEGREPSGGTVFLKPL